VRAPVSTRSTQSPGVVDTIDTIAGAWLFTPSPARDERGFFGRTMDVDWLRDVGIDPHRFVQDSVSRSREGVVRGLHLRVGRGEAKLVRCSRGAIFDVVVDVRTGSPTAGSVYTVVLRDDPPRTLYVPPGCAHGFQALTDPADTTYRIDRPHDATEDMTIAWDDPDLAVPWPRAVTGLSQRDRHARRLSEALEVQSR
jgi:dTDP-4-dehydrorhamnose 3,5-epimerase